MSRQVLLALRVCCLGRRKQARVKSGLLEAGLDAGAELCAMSAIGLGPYGTNRSVLSGTPGIRRCGTLTGAVAAAAAAELVVGARERVDAVVVAGVGEAG